MQNAPDSSWSPGARRTDCVSPVLIDSSISAVSQTTGPSATTWSPERSSTRSSCTTSEATISCSRPSRTTTAVGAVSATMIAQLAGRANLLVRAHDHVDQHDDADEARVLQVVAAAVDEAEHDERADQAAQHHVEVGEDVGADDLEFAAGAAGVLVDEAGFEALGDLHRGEAGKLGHRRGRLEQRRRGGPGRGDRGCGVAFGDQRRRGRRVDINGPQRGRRDVLGDGDPRSALRGRVGVGQRERADRGADSA